MAIGKWIGGFLGFVISGPLGALAGYALGYLFDKATESVPAETNYGNSSASAGTYANSYEQRQGQRNSFLFSLLVLSSYIIRADGKVMHSEMEFVRRFLRNSFGPAAEQQGEEILLKLFQKQKEIGDYEFREVIHDSCRQISLNMPYEQRLQLLAYLCEIAKADGVVSQGEVYALHYVASGLGVSAAEVDGMLNLHDASTNLDAAYKVFGVSPAATDEELRKAYRRLALQNHPDRVAALGDDVRKAAEKKFQEINAAKELIWKARGMK